MVEEAITLMRARKDQEYRKQLEEFKDKTKKIE